MGRSPCSRSVSRSSSGSGSSTPTPQEWVARVLLEGLVVTTLLPLVALVYGTAALGAEIEDGTAVYLLAKPMPRSAIILGKLLAAWMVTATAPFSSPALVAGAIAFGGARWLTGSCSGSPSRSCVGSLVYSALFVMLSVVTSRALIAGLVYVFVWEGVINGLFAGTRLLSVRHYTLAVADIFVDCTSGIFDAKLSAAAGCRARWRSSSIGATWYGIRRLERFEIGETT